jgi:putative ABC transport system permease protein
VAAASGLAPDLGTWVAVAALTASFAAAALLTLASVSRRIREFGTLKALGWPAHMITVQVLTETATVGIAGMLAGVALVSALGPTLTVSVTQLPSIAASPKATSAAPVPVHFSAQVSLGIVALAVALGILGTLLAGALGAAPPA